MLNILDELTISPQDITELHKKVLQEYRLQKGKIFNIEALHFGHQQSDIVVIMMISYQQGNEKCSN